MIDQRHSFYDDFQYKGVWWLPDSPNRRFPGVLSHHLKDNRVEFFGADADLSPSLDQSGLRFPFSRTIILGHLEGGEFCTLYEVHEVERPTDSSGFRRSIAQVQWLFLGAHFDTPESIRFHAVDLNFTSLDAWMFDSPIVTTENLTEAGGFAGWQATCRLPTAAFLSVPSINANVSFSYTTSHRPGITSYRFDHEPYIVLSFNGDRDLMECFWHMRQCQDFLTLLVGGPVALNRFVASAGPFRDRKRVQVFFAGSFSLARDPISKLDMWVRKSTIEHRLSELVPAWFAKWKELRECVSLFFGSLYNQGMYVESQFLSLCQALEVYSRVTTPSYYLSEQDYDAVQQTLVAAIPANVPKDFRTSLTSKLKWGNEFSLRKRVKNLLATLEPPTVALICANPKVYSKRLVDTRNYLTHYAGDPSAEPWPDDDLIYGSQSLRILLAILLLRQISLPEDAIRQALGQSNAASQIIQLYLARGLDQENQSKR